MKWKGRRQSSKVEDIRGKEESYEGRIQTTESKNFHVGNKYYSKKKEDKPTLFELANGPEKKKATKINGKKREKRASD